MSEDTKKEKEVVEEVVAPEVEVKKEQVEEIKEGKKEVEVEIPKKFKTIVDDIEAMSVLDLNELVKLLEKKFGVSAVAVAVAGGATNGGDEIEAKNSFDVELTSAGDQKIAVIKIVKASLGLGLKEAKELVDSAPVALKKEMKKDEAEALKAEIEGVGGIVELK